MTKFVAFAFLAAFSGTPLLAEPAATPAETSFTRDGDTFFFTQADMGGYTRIAGRDQRGRIFEFRVAGARVTGNYDGQYMEFSTSATKSAEVASR